MRVPWSALAFALLCSACLSTNRPFNDQQALSLRTGQTPEEVIAVLGEPASRLKGAKMDDDDALEEFGSALLENGKERLEAWIYVSSKGTPSSSAYVIDTSGYSLKSLNLHFVDGLVVRNDRKIGPDDLATVQVGMTRNEIVDRLGQPLLVTSSAGLGLWVYHAPDGAATAYLYVPVRFERKKLSYWGWPPEED